MGSSACGKIPFQSRGEANKYARKQRSKFVMQGTVTAYVCPRCGLFHLTRLSRAEQRRRFPNQRRAA